MKRDMELVRRLLLFLDEKPDLGVVEPRKLEIPGYSRSQVGYHFNLLAQAGFVNAETIRSKTTPSRIISTLPFDLTWSGHEFLDTIRDDEVWRKTKNAASTVKSFSFEVLKALAKAIVQEAIKKHFGIDTTI